MWHWIDHRCVPFSDNEGDITEMSQLDECVRGRTGILDATGNTTAVIEKGFAVGSKALVSLALFGDSDMVDSGSNGALVDNTFAFAGENALCMKTCYSYTATKGTCMTSSCIVETTHASVAENRDVSTDSEQVLMSTVAPPLVRPCKRSWGSLGGTRRDFIVACSFACAAFIGCLFVPRFSLSVGP